jgi:hypothetical protein
MYKNGCSICGRFFLVFHGIENWWLVGKGENCNHAPRSLVVMVVWFVQIESLSSSLDSTSGVTMAGKNN